MSKLKMCLAAAMLVIAVGFTGRGAVAQDAFLVIDGNHWQQLDEAQRVAFVSGVMHVLEFERQLKGDAMTTEEQSFVPFLIASVQGHTVGEVSIAVTDYYVAHPDDLGRPVIATMIRAFDAQPM